MVLAGAGHFLLCGTLGAVQPRAGRLSEITMEVLPRKPTALLLLTAASAAYVYVQAVYFVHMLQLNSYRPERYAAWRRENRDRLLSPLAAGGAAPSAAFLRTDPLDGRVGGHCHFVIPLGLFAPAERASRAKKPLVFTHRVMRLFGTLALLFAIAAAAAWLLPLWAAPAVYRAFFLPGFLVGGAGQPDQRSPWSGRWPTGMSGMPPPPGNLLPG